MIDRMQRSQFREWCDDTVGGEWEEDGEIKRCVLDSEGGPWNQRTGSFNIRNVAVVELRGDHGFYVEDTTGETLEIRDAEWENLMGTEREDEVENPEEHGYEEERVRRTGNQGGNLRLQTFGGDLVFRENHKEPDGTVWMRKVSVDPLKSGREIQNQVVTEEDLWEEAREEEWEQWKSSGQHHPEDLFIPRANKEQWLKQKGLWDEFKNLTEHDEPEPEHDEFPCPDGDFIEVEDGVELEGEIDRITCNDDVTRVDFTTEDGEAWSVEGSPEGWDPIELKQSGRTVDQLEIWDLEFLGSSGRVSSRR